MNKPSVLRAFLKKHRLCIAVLLLLLVLSLFSIIICKDLIAGVTVIPSWETQYGFPAVVVISLVAAFFKKYFFALLTFGGYHCGLALTMLGTENAIEALLISLFTWLIFLILGIWAEVFVILLKKRRGNLSPEQPTE